MLSTFINNQFKINYSKKVLIECNIIEHHICFKYFMCHKCSYISSYNFCCFGRIIMQCDTDAFYIQSK